MALPTFAPDKVFMNGDRSRFLDPSAARRSPDANEYAAQLGDPGSFVNGLLAVQSKLSMMGAYAAAGDMDAAKECYDDANGFFRKYPAETARAYSMNPRNDPFLESVRDAAAVGMRREYDSAELNTPYGRLPAGAMFGPNGRYESLRTESIQHAHFDSDVAALMASNAPEDASRKRMVKKIVDPVVKGFSAARGQTPQGLPVSQYSSLATHVRSSADDDIGKVGEAGVSTIIDRVIESHMDDSTAVATYKWMVKALEARRDGAIGSGVDPDKFDAAKAAHQIFDAYNSVLKEMVPGGSKIPGSIARLGAMTAFNLVAADPGIDFNDQSARSAIMDIASVIAMGERGGVQLIPTAQGMGVAVGDAVTGYVKARMQGLDAPSDNFMTRLIGLHSLASRIIASGWEATPGDTRADPTKEVGEASGVFRASSGFAGLDQAGVRLYKALVRGAMKGIAYDKNEVDAIREALESESVKEDMAAELSIGMAVPMPVARGVLGKLVGKITSDETGTLTSAGLERAVADFAFESDDTYGKPELSAAKKQAGKWYASNVGELGRYYDSLMKGGKLDEVLYDPVFGVGGSNPKEVKERVAMRKQEIKALMHEAAESGASSPLSVLNSWSRQGTYYKLAWRGPKGEILDKPPANVASPTPVVIPTFGNLDKASQTVSGVFPGGMMPYPRYGENSFSSKDPQVKQQFKLAQQILKELHDKQKAAAMKQASAGGGGGWGSGQRNY